MTKKALSHFNDVAVVGGGITGIAAALRMAASGSHRVTLLEKDEQIGGLCASYSAPDFECDRFYHVILSSDSYTIRFVKSLGLEKDLHWRISTSGFYGDGKLVPFGTAMDFVRFPFLSLFQKFRLGWGIVQSARIKNPEKLDSRTAPDWLKKMFGEKNYDRFWDPLLRTKLGKSRNGVSAAFIWATINRLYGARKRADRREILGYVKGGYRRILQEAQRTLLERSVAVMTSTSVKGMDIFPPGTSGSAPARSSHEDSNKSRIVLRTNRGHLAFQKVLLTLPHPEVIKLVKPASALLPFLDKVPYVGIICPLVVLKRRLSPYYVINLLDTKLPFTGVIESTAVLPSHAFQNHHLVYLPKYASPQDPLWKASDEEIRNLFMEGLKKVFPGLSRKDVVEMPVFRELHVQPVPPPGFYQRKKEFKTPLQGVYLANSSLIHDSTVNVNEAVRLGMEAAEAIIRTDSPEMGLE